MKKKIFTITFLLLILIANISLASYSTVNMSVVEEPVCTIEFGNNSKFEKKLISKNLANKEVTLQLQVTNEEKAIIPTGEIVLVIDNSNSMQELTSTGEVRRELINSSAKTLVSNLLKNNEQLKIGAVSFSTTFEKNAEGYLTLGTENDSKLLTNLTSNLSTLTSAIDGITYVGEQEASYTNLQSGLNRAKTLFSSEENDKYIIVLTDGVPNVILDRNSVQYDDDTISATKNEYASINTSGINTITMLTGIKDGDALIDTVSTYDQYIEKIFGTAENPTSGDFYYITDDKIEETITNDIYNSLVPTNTTLKNIEIVDYFPAEIVNNFEFAYVSEANIGEISATIDTTNNSITWTIPELEVGKTATVQYKLKLKEDFDSSIINKIIDTNEKVDLTYTDTDGNDDAKTSDVTPKLFLEEPPAELPKAGTPFIVALAVTAIGTLVFSFTKLVILNNKMK